MLASPPRSTLPPPPTRLKTLDKGMHKKPTLAVALGEGELVTSSTQPGACSCSEDQQQAACNAEQGHQS